MTTYRKGDIVTIKAEVRSDWTPTAPAGGDVNKVWLKPLGHYDTMFIDAENVTPYQYHFEVGETVRHGNDFVEIVHIIGENAWINLGEGQHGVVPVAKLGRLDSKDKPDPDFDEVEPLSPPEI